MNPIKSIVIWFSKKLAHVVPKKHNLWLFGAWIGDNYSDNSKYLFEYVSKYHPEINAVWMTRSKTALKQVNDSGFKGCHMYTVRGIWLAIRAEVAFETEGDPDVSFALDNKKTMVVQLWHGMGYKALKWKDESGKLLFSQETVARFNSYYWMSPSELYAKTISHNRMQVDPSRIYLTGYPRNDTFVKKPENHTISEILCRYDGMKRIIYMPTHRNFGEVKNLIIDKDELLKVDEMLRNENVLMVYKPHFHAIQNLIDVEDSFTNIVLAKNADIWSDVYSYIHLFDLLISDYSSIITDFLCSGKPIVLFSFDEEEFAKKEGLLDIYYDYPCGPITRTWNECMNTVFSLLKDDVWSVKREEMRKQYHEFNDGNNCERVFETVMKLLRNDRT